MGDVLSFAASSDKEADRPLFLVGASKKECVNANAVAAPGQVVGDEVDVVDSRSGVGGKSHGSGSFRCGM